MGDLSLLLPEAMLLAGVVLLFALTAFGASARAHWLVGVAAALGSTVASALWIDKAGEPFFPGIYKVDAFSQLLKLGVAAGLALSLLASERVGSFRKLARADIPLVMTLSALGMMMLVSATELLTLYVALELSAYGLYILVALQRDHRLGGEAAAKYVIFGAASSAVTLYGLSLVFGAAHSTYLVGIAQAPVSPLLVVGVFLALTGLLFKLALFPLHGWAPDAYQGAPHQAATFVGTASKVAAIGVILRFLGLTHDTHHLSIALAILAVASMTFGNLAALVQKDVKRLLAYSTIAHAGYMAIGLLTFSRVGAAAAIFYVLTYVPIAVCVFVPLIAIGRDGRNPRLSDLSGLYARSPLLAMSLLIGMFGLAGIPPTPGFAGKWFLFSAAIDKDLLWLVLVAAVNATVSLYYYLMVVKAAFRDPPGARGPVPVSLGETVAVLLAIVMVLWSGAWPGPLWDLAARAAGAL